MKLIYSLNDNTFSKFIKYTFYLKKEQKVTNTYLIFFSEELLSLSHIV